VTDNGMGVPWRAIWGVITKRWAYVSASLLCIVVVTLLAASCGTCWYEVRNLIVVHEHKA